MSDDAVWASSLGISESQLNEWNASAEGHVSLLIWCLENQKVDEDNYLAWAQKHYQVAQLNSDFFKSQPLPFDLFDQHFANLPQTTIPIAVWDGVLFIASPDPLPELSLEQPHQWVLASWIQIINWRNQYEKELNAKSNGSAALSSLDFGALDSNIPSSKQTEKTPATTPIAVVTHQASSHGNELPSLFSEPIDSESTTSESTVPESTVADSVILAPALETPLAVVTQPISPATPVVAPNVTTPAIKPPSIAAKPTTIPLAKVAPPPKVSPAPTPAVSRPQPPPLESDKTVIQAGGAKPPIPRPVNSGAAGAPQPRPSSGTNSAIRSLGAIPAAGTSSGTSSTTSPGIQTRSNAPLRPTSTGTPPKPTAGTPPKPLAGTPPKSLAGGPPKPAATNRPVPQSSSTRSPSMDQTSTKIPRPKAPLGTEADEQTKTGFSKTALGQTKVARVKLGADTETGTATAIRVQRPATNGVVVMDPRFKIDHPKYLKSLDDLPFYLLHRLRDLYDKTMILTFTGGILKPWRWDDSWGHPNDQTQSISIADPSMFKIPIQTKTPYHGHIVKNAVHDMFLTEWSPKLMPEHVTILPMMVDGNVTGLVLGVVKQNKVSRIRLEDIEPIAIEAAQLMMTLPSRVASAA